MSDASHFPGEGAVVPLPVDVDGEVIRIGDEVVNISSGFRYTVESVEIHVRNECNIRYYICVRENDHAYVPRELRHYHKPTVEDVLHDFAVDLNVFDAFESLSLEESDHISDVINEYAAKLRLKEEE